MLHSQFVHKLNKLALLALSLSWCTTALADVVLPLGLETRLPVPANGVLKFPSGLTVRIVAEDGTEVPGRFIREGVWRPYQSFDVGTYLADVSYEINPDRAEDRTFEVIPALTLPADFVQVMVASRVSAVDVLEQVCCESGVALNGGLPCATQCTPLCVPLAYSAKQTVEVYADVNNLDPLAWQVQILVAQQVEAGQFQQGTWEVVDSPEELCGVVDVFSWLDETTSTVVRCIPNPKPDLSPIREEPTTFGNITECTQPPLSYEQQWCTAQAYVCEVQLLTVSEPEYEVLFKACQSYYTICDRAVPESPVWASATDHTGPDGAADDNPVTHGVDSSSDASCSVNSRPKGPTPWLMLLAWFGSTAWLRLRVRCMPNRTC